jgi:hypothetical protein
MGLSRVTRAYDVRLPLGLKGWQFAIAMGAAIILAPVVGLVLLLLVGTLIPVLPLLAMLFASLRWIGHHSALPSTPVRPPRVLRPRISHASAPDPRISTLNL